jgi:hypothetical protein
VGAVVISQGVGYCEYQGVAPVNFFLDSVEGGGHFELVRTILIFTIALIVQ